MTLDRNRPQLDVIWRTDGHEATSGDVAVVVDVLRASTNILTAFANGAARVRSTRSVQHARKLAKTYGAILMGERQNQIIPGFDYGNSPATLKKVDLSEATIVFTSTNFPHALFAARKAEYVLLGALVNLRAVCRRALDTACKHNLKIMIILAGEPFDDHAWEDLYFAGRAVQLLSHDCRCTDRAQICAHSISTDSPKDTIVKSTHAKTLIEDGFAEDVTFAFELDIYNIVPYLQDEWIKV